MRSFMGYAMRRGCGILLSGALVLCSAPAGVAQPGMSTPGLEGRFGAPGSAERRAIVEDLRARVASGEISPFQILIPGVVPIEGIIEFGGPGAAGDWGGKVRMRAAGRGAAIATFGDDFSTYPLSDDPIFDRFQVGMDGQTNPAGEAWSFTDPWYIPSLFIDGQTDQDAPWLLDPLPQWQGVTLTEDDDLGVLTADLNGDMIVDTSDLGQLIGVFGMTGAPGFDPADINQDGVIDTSDLGQLIGQFGQSAGPFCVYLVTETHGVDPDGAALDPLTIANGPTPGQTVAILNGAYSTDGNADGCPDCDSFRILSDGAAGGERVYGDWTLSDPMQVSASGADFRAVVSADDCPGWGSEQVLTDARSLTDEVEPACCFFGARTEIPFFVHTSAETPLTPLTVESDFFLTSYDTFTWFDATSSIEELIFGRAFLGGHAPSLDVNFEKYSTRPDGLINHFIFLGNLPIGFPAGQFYGTVPDPLVGNQGKEILLNEWFTLSLRLNNNQLSAWLRDSETMALTDPMPGDDGSATPLDGSDDIEDGFAKIFPIGPYGISPGAADGQIPEIPQPPFARSADNIRFLYGGDPPDIVFPGYSPRPVFMDNLRVEGALFPTPELPEFTLPYLDDMETYFDSFPLELQGDRWFDDPAVDAFVVGGFSNSGQQSIQEQSQSDDDIPEGYRPAFETPLPPATAAASSWTAGAWVALSSNFVGRGVTLFDDADSQNPFVVARLLFGVVDEDGVPIFEPGPSPPEGSTRLHMRVENPNFDPGSPEVEPDFIHEQPPSPPLNRRFINVPTNLFWDDQNVFHHFTFEVGPSGDLTVRRDGVELLPAPALAIDAGYTDGMGGLYKNGWDAGSLNVSRMSFESDNRFLGVTIWVDDVTLDGDPAP